MRYRLRRGLLAMLSAVILLGLAIVGSPPMSGGRRGFTAAVVFLAYGIYVRFSRHEGQGFAVGVGETALMGGVCGVAIALLSHPSIGAALIGLVVGVLFGAFADKWTRFIDYL